jgi:hypothetical protein
MARLEYLGRLLAKMKRVKRVRKADERTQGDGVKRSMMEGKGGSSKDFRIARQEIDAQARTYWE